MWQRKRIVALVMAGAALTVWEAAPFGVASAAGPNDATQSAYAEKASFVPTACVIADLAGKEHVYWVPLYGDNDTVIDAIAWDDRLLNTVSRHRIWVMQRAACVTESPRVLPVDWQAIVRGDSRTNYVLRAGDILYAK
jgi:hypothetical protein